MGDEYKTEARRLKRPELAKYKTRIPRRIARAIRTPLPSLYRKYKNCAFELVCNAANLPPFVFHHHHLGFPLVCVSMSALILCQVSIKQNRP